MSGTPILTIENLCVSYGNIPAVQDVSFRVEAGDMVTLVGVNGAGKTSILRAISGLVPFTGNICYDGMNLVGVSAHRITARGIAHVPEGRAIFANLKVSENLKLATWHRKDKREIAVDYERVFALFPILFDRRQQLGGTLSGGEQQMLAVGRALMSRGRVMLLDEPSMGLSPLLVQEIFAILKEINRTGTTILLVEQNARMALRAASYGYVLETGTIVLAGSGQQLIDNPAICTAYLGG